MKSIVLILSFFALGFVALNAQASGDPTTQEERNYMSQKLQDAWKVDDLQITRIIPGNLIIRTLFDDRYCDQGSSRGECQYGGIQVRFSDSHKNRYEATCSLLRDTNPVQQGQMPDQLMYGIYDCSVIGKWFALNERTILERFPNLPIRKDGDDDLTYRHHWTYIGTPIGESR